tara:strand:+ start:48 stop:602 length:555 start_codon:yes stop_codon:yes gene_type:complete
MASLSFNAEEIDVSDQLVKYPPIPEDIYKAVIIDSEMKPTKAGNGAYLELKFEVIDSQYEGKWIKARLNLQNQNPKAVEIAERDLSSICRAIGKKAIADSEELHHKPLQIKVVIQPARGEYAASNEIKAYSPANAPAPVATIASASKTTSPALDWVSDFTMTKEEVEAIPDSPAPAAAGKKPWE